MKSQLRVYLNEGPLKRLNELIESYNSKPSDIVEKAILEYPTPEELKIREDYIREEENLLDHLEKNVIKMAEMLGRHNELCIRLLVALKKFGVQEEKILPDLNRFWPREDLKNVGLPAKTLNLISQIRGRIGTYTG